MPVPSKKRTKESEAERMRLWRAANPERAKESARKSMAKWRAANPEKAKERAKANYAKNGIKHGRTWRSKNPEKMREVAANWRAKNPGLNAAQSVLTHATKLRATPAWANLDVIKAIYAVAEAYRIAGIKVEVDHTIPLRGKFVRGFHVHENLTIVPFKHNRSKGNKLCLSQA